MLKDLEKLDEFLDRVFSGADLPAVSVKTRVGIEDPEEVNALAELYKKYPFEKIIVHPRLLKDLYKGSVRKDCFHVFYENFESHKLVFNGDINTVSDAAAVAEEFPGVGSIMLGRGLLADPLLPEKIKAAAAKDPDTVAASEVMSAAAIPGNTSATDAFPAAGAQQDNASADAASRIHAFLDDLWDDYAAYLSGDADVLAKMKELWSYLYRSFDNGDSVLKAVRKARTKRDYIMGCQALWTR